MAREATVKERLNRADMGPDKMHLEDKMTEKPFSAPMQAIMSVLNQF